MVSFPNHHTCLSHSFSNLSKLFCKWGRVGSLSMTSPSIQNRNSIGCFYEGSVALMLLVDFGFGLLVINRSVYFLFYCLQMFLKRQNLLFFFFPLQNGQNMLAIRKTILTKVLKIHKLLPCFAGHTENTNYKEIIQYVYCKEIEEKSDRSCRKEIFTFETGLL